MSNAWILAGLTTGLFVVVLVYLAWVFGRQRQEAAGRFSELELKSVAARLGVALDPESIGGGSAEGDRLLTAMAQCNKCQSVEACHAFLADEQANGASIAAFCPNAVYLLAPHGWRQGNRTLAWYA